MKQPAVGQVPAAAANQHSSPAGVPGPYDTDISWVFNGNDGTSCQPLAGSLQVYDIDAITFLCVGGLFHLEVEVGATSGGSCCKEFEDILILHFQDLRAPVTVRFP